MTTTSTRALALLLLIAASYADEVVIVLQNGRNSYTGCTDSYLYSVGAVPETVNMNFGDADRLKTAN